jgi:hypothetical protein
MADNFNPIEWITTKEAVELTGYPRFVSGWRTDGSFR